jgi:hypothetical protein
LCRDKNSGNTEITCIQEITAGQLRIAYILSQKNIPGEIPVFI